MEKGISWLLLDRNCLQLFFFKRLKTQLKRGWPEPHVRTGHFINTDLLFYKKYLIQKRKKNFRLQIETIYTHNLVEFDDEMYNLHFYAFEIWFDIWQQQQIFMHDLATKCVVKKSWEALKMDANNKAPNTYDGNIVFLFTSYWQLFQR